MKNIQIIHIKELTKEKIYDIYEDILNGDHNEYYQVNDGYFSDNSFWETIKNYCNDLNVESISKLTSKPKEYDYFILVGLNNHSQTNSSYSVDYICMQLFLGFLTQLSFPYKVCFYELAQDTITPQNYYRTSLFLNAWAIKEGVFNAFKYLNASSEISNQAEKYNPKRLALKFTQDTVSENVLPIISLNRTMYHCLDSDYNLNRKISSLNELLSTIENSLKSQRSYYEEYLYQAISKMLDTDVSDEWNNFENRFLRSQPSLITVYIYAMIKSHIDKADFENWSFQSLIEKCFDYSNGLMQLIENSVKHVVEKCEKSHAFFTIRMHHTVGDLDKYLAKSEFSNLKYFLELSVMDCTPPSYDSGILSRYNETLRESGLEPINYLKEIFEYPSIPNSTLETYYSNASNVANHYGLQIFDTIVTSNRGLFIVRSGNTDSSDVYSNDKKVFSTNGAHVYKEISENYGNQHFCGTSYTIVLPLIKVNKENVALNLLLCNTPLEINKELYNTDCIDLVPITLSGRSKEYFINQYVNCIHDKIKGLTNGIVAFNINEASKSRIQLELLCKSVVSVISDPSYDKIKVICLLNIVDEYKLLEAVRLIALFYDKTGHCDFIKNKAIYLSSCNQYDIMFYDNKVSSVLENIEQQRLVKNLPQTFYDHIFAALKDRIS